MKNLLTFVFLLAFLSNNYCQENAINFIDSLILEGQDDQAMQLIDKKLKLSNLEASDKIILLTQATQLHLYNKEMEAVKNKLASIKDISGLQTENSDDILARIALVEVQFLRANKKIPEAKKVYLEALNTLDFDKVNSITTNSFFLNFARLYRSQKKYDSLRYIVDIGSKYLKSINDPHLQSKLTYDLIIEKAYGYQLSSEFKKARKVYSDLLETAYARNDTAAIGKLNTSIAQGYFYSGDYGQCAHHVKKSLEVRLKKYGEKSTQALKSYQNLAVTYTKMENYEDASTYYEKAYEIIKTTDGENSLEIGRIHFNIGIGHFQKEEFEKAIDRFEKSLKIRKELLDPDHLDIAHSLQLIGNCYLNRKEYNKAKVYYAQALEIREKSGNKKNPDLTRLYSNMAITIVDENDYSLALDYVDKAYQTIGYNKNNRFDFDLLDNPFMLSNPLEIEVQIFNKKYKSSGNPQIYFDAANSIKSADSIMNYMKYYLDDPSSRLAIHSKQRLLFDEVINIHNTHYKNEGKEETLAEVFRLIEKGKNNLMYEKIAADDSEFLFGMPIKIIDEKYALEDSISFYEEKILLDGDKSEADFIKKATDFKTEYYAFLEKMKTEYPKYFQSVYEYPLISLSDYKVAVNDNETSISYYLGNESTLAIKVENGNTKLYDLGYSDEIVAAAKKMIATLKDRSDTNTYDKAAEAIYKKLISPLELEEGKELTLICDEILSLIPFEALRDESGKYLLESHVISYQYSATIKAQEKKEKKYTSDILAMAPVFDEEVDSNPLFASLYEADVFRDEMGPLLQSENELKNIKTDIKGRYYLRSEATEAQFKKYAPDAKVIHLATHGFANQDNVDNSRLYFHQSSDTIEDGMLNAYEIVNMNIKADLITLSACNTGSGKIQKGEGIASLGRAFAYAGATNQLLTLWSVNDRSTTQLMSNYYKKLKEGQSKSEALRSSKLDYLESSPELLRHPYYWAGFVYYGDDTPLPTPPIQYLGIILGAGIGLLLLGLYFKYNASRKDLSSSS